MALTRVGNVRIVQGGVFRTHYEFRAPTRGGQYWYCKVSKQRYEHLQELQQSEPVSVLRAEGRTWWWYQREFYQESDGYTSEEVKLLLWERDQKKRRKVERLRKELLSDHAIEQARRERIPEDVRIFVWKRDGGRCAHCGSQETLEFDHIIPLAKGGSSTARNIQLLCETCNRRKSDSL